MKGPVPEGQQFHFLIFMASTRQLDRSVRGLWGIMSGERNRSTFMILRNQQACRPIVPLHSTHRWRGCWCSRFTPHLPGGDDRIALVLGPEGTRYDLLQRKQVHDSNDGEAKGQQEDEQGRQGTDDEGAQAATTPPGGLHRLGQFVLGLRRGFEHLRDVLLDAGRELGVLLHPQLPLLDAGERELCPLPVRPLAFAHHILFPLEPLLVCLPVLLNHPLLPLEPLLVRLLETVEQDLLPLIALAGGFLLALDRTLSKGVPLVVALLLLYCTRLLVLLEKSK